MIEVYYWPTPTCMKITIMLEECGLAYRITPVDIGAAVQYSAAYRAINPNCRVPAIVDHAPAGGAGSITVFESGAILQYLADKTGAFWPRDPRGRAGVSQWLFWQVSGLGPMAGQCGHFLRYAPEPLAYPIQRYATEVSRLYGVMEHVLDKHSFLAGDEYSIADIAAWPWILPETHGQDLSAFPSLARWHERIAQRPAVQRARKAAQDMRGDWNPIKTPEVRRNMFAYPIEQIWRNR
jgi:GST-like protein